MSLSFSIYNIFDLILAIFIAIFTYISYKNRSYLKIFEYFKIFFIVTVSAKLAYPMGVLLQKLYILKVDTYTTLILISFIVNVAILYFGWESIFKLSNRFIKSEKIKQIFARVITLLNVVVLSTFSLYIAMQIYIIRVYMYKPLHKTYSYPKIERFYKKFLNDEFVNMILHSDTGTNSKEVIFKSLKNSF